MLPNRKIQWEIAIAFDAADILEDWQARTTIGRVSGLRSCHPFLQLNTHDAEISAFIHATEEEATVTWE